MMHHFWDALLLLSISIPFGFSAVVQVVPAAIAPSQKSLGVFSNHVVDSSVLAALKTHPDPVDALVFLRPGFAEELAQPRLLHVLGETRPEWRTEGDKLRLRRSKRRFVDITDHQDFYQQQMGVTYTGKAREFAHATQSWLSIYTIRRHAQPYASAPDQTIVSASVNARNA